MNAFVFLASPGVGAPISSTGPVATPTFGPTALTVGFTVPSPLTVEAFFANDNTTATLPVVAGQYIAMVITISDLVFASAFASIVADVEFA
jgi:hypothetical protein